MIIELITAIGIFSALIYLLILLYLTIGIIRTKTEQTDEQPFVSVIVTAHNESQNIATCLNSILKQDYPHDKMEIIIVNDRSEDDTGLIVDTYEMDYTMIRVITITASKPGLSPKKYALNQAISSSIGEIIATTDADCMPHASWLTTLVANFTPETGMVVGLAPLRPTSWWMSPLMCLDALMASLAAYGSLGWKHPVAATGRNIAYRKITFDEVHGFSGLMHILSGDDILLVQKVSEKTDWVIRFQPDSDALVPSYAPGGWAQFITQRKRHIFTSKYFPLSIKIGFSLLFLSKLFTFIVFILLLFTFKVSYPPNILFISSYLLTLSLFYSISSKTGQSHLLIFYPLWELYYLLNHIIIGPLGLLGKVKWGTRKTI